MTIARALVPLCSVVLALGSAACKGDPPPAKTAKSKAAKPKAAKPKKADAPPKRAPAAPGGGDAKSGTTLPKGITKANLEKVLPLELRGAERKLMNADAFGGSAPEAFVAAAYLLEDEQRHININIKKIKDLDHEKAQFLIQEDGEEKEGNGRSLLGREIDGRLVQRSHSHTMGDSEVIMLIDDQIWLRLSVEKAEDPDEALELLESIDIEAIASLIP